MGPALIRKTCSTMHRVESVRLAQPMPPRSKATRKLQSPTVTSALRGYAQAETTTLALSGVVTAGYCTPFSDESDA